MAFIYDLADTWNDGATTFTGIKLNVTDSASAAASNLMDLQVGGVSRFRVAKNGDTDIGNGSSDVVLRNGATGRFITIGTSAGGIGLLGSSPGNNRISLGSSANVSVGGSLRFTSGASLGWVPSTDAFAALDVSLFRDAANTLAQRNGVNAQAFNLYNTYTDASNYERLSVSYDGTQFSLVTNNAGTGSARPLRIATPSSSIAIDAQNGVQFRSGNGGTQYSVISNDGLSLNARYFQMTEQTAPAAPAANGVRIYAEDDGAGKTRLMARFATGAAVQIAIEP